MRERWKLAQRGPCATVQLSRSLVLPRALEQPSRQLLHRRSKHSNPVVFACASPLTMASVHCPLATPAVAGCSGLCARQPALRFNPFMSSRCSRVSRFQVAASKGFGSNTGRSQVRYGARSMAPRGAAGVR